MTFQSPQFLWLLLIGPALVWVYLWLLRRRKAVAVRFPDLALVRAAMGPGQRIRRHLPPALLLVALLAMLIAVARPNAVIPLLANQQTVILAIDVSMSMRAVDVEPTRILAAQAAAKSFIEELPPDIRAGIVAFAGTASLVQAPTQQREELLAAVERLQLQRHTATGSGLLVSLAALLPEAGIDVEALSFGKGWPRREAAAERAKPPVESKPFTPVPPGSYKSGAIVLMSDGRRTVGPDPIAAARMAAERGVKVYTVGFGTVQGGAVDFGGWSVYMRLDEETLKQVAEITRAEYYHATSGAELKKVYAELSGRLAVEHRQTEVGALFAALAALLVLVAGGLSVVWFRRAA